MIVHCDKRCRESIDKNLVSFSFSYEFRNISKVQQNKKPDDGNKSYSFSLKTFTAFTSKSSKLKTFTAFTSKSSKLKTFTAFTSKSSKLKTFTAFTSKSSKLKTFTVLQTCKSSNFKTQQLILCTHFM